MFKINSYLLQLYLYRTCQHHRIVATEIVKPLEFDTPESILQNVIVLLDPKIPDCSFLVDAANKRGLMVMGVCLKPNDGSNPFMPTAESLLSVGMHQVYEPPIGTKFDVVECAVCISMFNICFSAQSVYISCHHYILHYILDQSQDN